jgi:hypothetical protein
MTEDEIRNLLREMRDEPIPPDSRARVGMAVAERIQSRSSVSMFHGRWKVAAVLSALASIVAVLMFLGPSKNVHERTPSVAARQAEGRFETAAPPEKIATAHVNVFQRAKHPAHRTAQPAFHGQQTRAARGGVLIRIETPDPDVVIVLVGG